MSLAAFDGAAGSGKTYSVMQRLAVLLAEQPLGPGQRVLALTFMHGARHRLDEQLEAIALVQGKFEATTIDSFAWTICTRWRSRLRERNLVFPTLEDPNAFEAICGCAESLLADTDVRKWVAASYPYILVDEAQDLNPVRLELIAHLTHECCVLLAFDEFQCLRGDNRPAAVVNWVVGKCEPTVLGGNHRTSVNELLAAALQVRSGGPLTAKGQHFGVRSAPAQKAVGPRLAATLIAYELMKDGTFALLSPARPTSSSYVRDIVELLRTEKLGKDSKLGPFAMRWEGGDDDGSGALRTQLLAANVHRFDEALAILASAPDLPAARQTATTLRLHRDARGTSEFNTAQLLAFLDRNIQLSNQFGRRKVGRRRALTIHQAKNREFDRVVVLWPFQVPSNHDDRRRLLYNAITRARRSCLVIVQTEKMLQEPPFA